MERAQRVLPIHLVLDRFPKFFSAAVGKPIEVDNPFIWKTKEDVFRSLLITAADHLSNTLSVARVLRHHQTSHPLRMLFPVSRRRFAILAAKAAGHDPVEMFKVELLAGPRDRPNDQTMADPTLELLWSFAI